MCAEYKDVVGSGIALIFHYLASYERGQLQITEHYLREFKVNGNQRITMLHFIVVFSSLALLTAAQTCPNGGLPSISGLCPAGYALIPSTGVCCDNKDLVNCTDQVNPKTGVLDCPGIVAYCNNAAYYTLMTQQCPKTCGRCSSTCVDQINPKTGVSDCLNMVPYCNTPVYYTLLTQQCPKTCGRCSG